MMTTEPSFANFNALLASGVVIFSLTSCPYCKTVKELFSKKKVIYTVIEFNTISGRYRDILTQYLIQRLGKPCTFPTVFVDGKYIGGCNDGGIGGVIPLEKEGLLDSIVKKHCL